MRPSYRPRNQSSHGHRGPGRGFGGGGGGGLSSSGGAPRVTAPKPIQTSSIKAESGVFDLTTILVPAASKERGGTWGRANLVTGTEAKADRAPPAAPLPPAAIGIATGKLTPSRDAASPTSSERSSSPEADSNGGRGRRPAAAETEDPVAVHPARESAGWGAPTGSGSDPTRAGSAMPDGQGSRHVPRTDPLSEASGEARHPLAPLPRQEPDTRASPVLASSQAAPLSGELFPPLGRQDPAAEKGSCSGASSEAARPALHADGSEPSKDAASKPSFVVSDTPAPSVFQTPSPDEADTEEERERRRRSLALEQQRLILEQVEAARAAAKASKKAAPTGQPPSRKPVSVIMRRTTNHNPKKDAGVGTDAKATSHSSPVQLKVARKGPRTKGKLYSRLADGSLVEEGIGDTLPVSLVDGIDDGDAKRDEPEPELALAGEPAASKANNTSTQANPSKGKPSTKKNWGSKNRRPKKHQVAALVGG